MLTISFVENELRYWLQDIIARAGRPLDSFDSNLDSLQPLSANVIANKVIIL